MLPNDFEAYRSGTQLLIVGGVAIAAALAASGLNYSIVQALAGYPLKNQRTTWGARALYGLLVGRQQRRFDELCEVRDSDDQPSEARTYAAWLLDRFFPDGRDRLLPTALGNAICAFGDHAYTRWGRDGVAIWPRIELLLSPEQHELHSNAKIDFNVWVNATVAAVIIGLVLIADWISNAPARCESRTYWRCSGVGRRL